MRPDPRFAAYGHQLMLLGEVARLLDHSRPKLLEDAKRSLRSDLDSDDVDSSTRSDLKGKLEDGVVTRFLMGGIIIGAWAVFEEAVQDVADYAYWKLQAATRFEDVPGEFVNRTAKYFTDVLHLDCFATRADVERLRAIALLRHVTAHANGRLSSMRAQRAPFERWARSQPGIVVAGDDYVVVGFPFVQRSLTFMHALISRMVDEVGARAVTGARMDRR